MPEPHEVIRRREEAVARRAAIIDRVRSEKRDHLTTRETAEFERLSEKIEICDEQIEDIERSGRLNPTVAAVRRAMMRVEPLDHGAGHGGDWASRAATALQRMGGTESRAVTSGSVDIPSLVEPNVTPMARPGRLVDLLVNRKSVPGNSFEYYRQSVRTNNAAPVADGQVKPVSVFTAEAVEDRCRVLAHLSEAIPLRLLADHAALQMFLQAEMVEGVLDSLENQVVSGSGAGEEMTGILSVSGTTSVAFDTDEITTLRKAKTALQLIGEQPDAIVVHPSAAEAIDLAREGAEGAFLADGYGDNASRAGTDNVFGSVARVVSTNVPAGTAILGDWSKVCVYVREGVRIDVDTGGENFSRNTVTLRGECRVGLAVLRPSSFAIVSLV